MPGGELRTPPDRTIEFNESPAPQKPPPPPPPPPPLTTAISFVSKRPERAADVTADGVADAQATPDRPMVTFGDAGLTERG